MYSLVVSLDCMFDCMYMIIGYEGIIRLFFPYAPADSDRLPEGSTAENFEVAYKLTSFFMPLLSLLSLLPMAWDNVMMARVYDKLSAVGHPISEKKRISEEAAQKGKEQHANDEHQSHGARHYFLASLPWLFVVGMWCFAGFLVMSMTQQPFCSAMHVCKQDCSPRIQVRQTDPELLNKPLRVDNDIQYCVLGQWKGALTYMYDDADSGVAKGQIRELPAAVEIYPQKLAAEGEAAAADDSWTKSISSTVSSALGLEGTLADTVGGAAGTVLKAKIVIGDFDLVKGKGIGAGLCTAYFDVICQENKTRSAFVNRRDPYEFLTLNPDLYKFKLTSSTGCFTSTLDNKVRGRGGGGGGVRPSFCVPLVGI
jgi:hypothetical protein